MAYSNNGGGEDLYGDGGMASTEEAPAPEESTESEDNTALLPKEFFQGKDLKPGTECKIRIAKVYDDQVGVEYVPHGEDDGETEAKVPSGMAEMMED